MWAKVCHAEREISRSYVAFAPEQRRPLRGGTIEEEACSMGGGDLPATYKPVTPFARPVLARSLIYITISIDLLVSTDLFNICI